MAYECIEYLNQIENEIKEKYIFMKSTSDRVDEQILAQVISLDIRGDYGFFLKRDMRIDEVIWQGNAFEIKVNYSNKDVFITDLFDDDRQYNVSYNEWESALNDWKKEYLKRLGFLEFSSVSLNHMLSVLLLANELLEPKCSYYEEVFAEAIKRSAERYGVSKSVIYRDCRKMVGGKSISRFYEWAAWILIDNLKKKNFKFWNILEMLEKRSNGISMKQIKKYFSEYLGIIISNEYM